MKKKFLLIIGILVLILFFTPKGIYEKYYYDFLEWKNLRDKIVWKENIKLNKKDFKSTESGENLVLYAKVGLSIRYFTNPIMFKSKTVFIPKESFLKTANDSISLRISEAKFNLLEIYRRKMETYVKNRSYNRCKGCS